MRIRVWLLPLAIFATALVPWFEAESPAGIYLLSGFEYGAELLLGLGALAALAAVLRFSRAAAGCGLLAAVLTVVSLYASPGAVVDNTNAFRAEVTVPVLIGLLAIVATSLSVLPLAAQRRTNTAVG